jgi:hypothetical protein
MQPTASLPFRVALRRTVAAVAVWSCGLAPAIASDASPANDEVVTLRTEGFSLLPVRKTRSFRRSKNGYGNQYIHANSAIPLQAGTGQYRNVLVSWNTVTYAASKRLMLGGGIDLYSTINAARLSPVWTVRLQYCGPLSETVHLGGTAFYLALPLPANSEDPAAEDELGLAAAMAQLTIGSPDNQLTLSGGMARVGDDSELRPILSGAAAVRIFANVQALTEHWVLLAEGDDLLAHSFALRVVGDFLAFDVGLFYNKELSERAFSWGMPFLAASLNF